MSGTARRRSEDGRPSFAVTSAGQLAGRTYLCGRWEELGPGKTNCEVKEGVSYRVSREIVKSVIGRAVRVYLLRNDEDSERRTPGLSACV